MVTHSSGNHAQAIARSARLLGIRAVVVMPNNAPAIKVAGVRADGAEIVFVGPDNEERVQRAHELADGEGLELVSSANDVRVIAGQGTVGLEIVEQLAELGVGRRRHCPGAGRAGWAVGRHLDGREGDVARVARARR